MEGGPTATFLSAIIKFNFFEFLGVGVPSGDLCVKRPLQADHGDLSEKEARRASEVQPSAADEDFTRYIVG